jgi:O-methyltransferase involved in polyketide biosynthesis
MKVCKTAALTAVWRKMGNVDNLSIRHVPLHLRVLARVLGILDRPSVDTITKRTIAIDSLIREKKPKVIVEIGCGYSSRPEIFQKTKFYQLDLKEISATKKNVISLDAGKDTLDLDIKEAFFIVEGLTMYLNDKEVSYLLNQIKKYKGRLAIDFFNTQNSTHKKSFREKLYKSLFKMLIGKNHLFDFRIENQDSGKELLRKAGFRNITFIDYKINKTLDSLFYAEF